MTDTVIADLPPEDGREWDCQCARCGSSCSREVCETCGGSGVDGHDCGEESCCCQWPEDNLRCETCLGDAGWQCCLSPREWCEAHPAPGREGVQRGEIEWYVVLR